MKGSFHEYTIGTRFKADNGCVEYELIKHTSNGCGMFKVITSNIGFDVGYEIEYDAGSFLRTKCGWIIDNKSNSFKRLYDKLNG